ncbi:tyrosine--tRNA ligase [Paenibacillus sp. GD4]|jgi:tyrosyl-tRNA synthetase|uniref:tyrosine--tRNA ligase n=1 Tax=Paenibacillus sp. GD4 TaxID=3068890 RepID=UPI002796BE1E|nr:tyrosine--tRNA ligase [Paenibacillus sp. GD4]MDQ1913138.1 tyrosine--tRNA ligase [Paenibacillus sp. GD4]
MSLLQDLEFRGLIHQMTDREGLEKKMNEGPIALYAGFDPTADSLHLGHLLPILTLRRFQLAGHIPIALVGGGTGLIGDPSGRSTERSLNSSDIVAEWTERLRQQLSRFLSFEAEGNAAQMVNNFDWLGNLNVIGFLRDIGKNFTVNYMLAKDSVDSRLEKGISFTEFSYMILQAYDFFKLNEDNNCSLQIGGSDQWGNITAGLELIGKTTSRQAFGMTMPLITKSDGTKFGKTAGGAVWLDPAKTSPYQFYQFWVNTDDNDVIKFLKYFTFLSPGEIEQMELQVKESPEKREAQRVLASEMTELVHGKEAVQSAIKISEVLFSGNVGSLNASEIEEAFKDVPSTEIAENTEIGLIDLLVEVKAAPSKRQARQDIESGAISINGNKVTDLEKRIGSDDRIEGRYLVLRRGKRNYYMVKFI